jgi:hypothetical protein
MSFLEDLGTGITDAVNQNLARYQVDNTTTAPVSGNTGAYFGHSIVDAVSTWISAGADAARKKLVNQFSTSGTGSKMIEEARSQELQKWLSNPMTWIIAGAVIFGFIWLGRATR